LISVPNDEMRRRLGAIQQVWRSAFGTRRVTYLSGPITTGTRFVDWYERKGFLLRLDSSEYRDAHRSNVIEPNEIDLTITADLLRARDNEPVVEPASLFLESWSQTHYINLWESFIANHASRVLFMPGWEYSAGCAAEFCRAHSEGIRTATIEGTPIVARDGFAAISNALSRLKAMEHPPIQLVESLHSVCTRLDVMLQPVVITIRESPRKDQSLDQLAELINVAQFVSFEPHRQGPRQAYSRVLGEAPNTRFKAVREAGEILLARSPESSVNVRSFTPSNPLSREFIYGLTSVDEIVSSVERLSAENLNTIINETVDIRDGGCRASFSAMLLSSRQTTPPGL
jgi:hypothetical protein